VLDVKMPDLSYTHFSCHSLAAEDASESLRERCGAPMSLLRLHEKFAASG